MPPVPPEQCSNAAQKKGFGNLLIEPSSNRAQTPQASVSIHQRQGDRGNGDDHADAQLPVYVRFSDLVAHGLVGNWTQLLRLIDAQGFPCGQMLSPNCRAWRTDDVNAWLASRPTARKIAPPARRPRGRKKNQPEAKEANATS
jgi:hypothetical protein